MKYRQKSKSFCYSDRREVYRFYTGWVLAHLIYLPYLTDFKKILIFSLFLLLCLRIKGFIYIEETLGNK